MNKINWFKLDKICGKILIYLPLAFFVPYYVVTTLSKTFGDITFGSNFDWEINGPIVIGGILGVAIGSLILYFFARFIYMILFGLVDKTSLFQNGQISQNKFKIFWFISAILTAIFLIPTIINIVRRIIISYYIVSIDVDFLFVLIIFVLFIPHIMILIKTFPLTKKNIY